MPIQSRDMTPSVQRETFTTLEASRVVGVCTRTLIKSTAPRLRVGRRLVWPADSLRAWLNQQNEEKE